ncbi:hypothetical protein HYH03_009359 [Edaphochlamys debaryana]|uniref:Uncharacterized protein n=1 Tax=Edaphochlamys debaryana TaxID=47281 RepID=A0A836BX66_9CHLO|nr:hypothetical protein HYH03_009359 [Edaphochlamys debaryana]|eukprot:KAG2492416.1 hypothetical protein HYH03_009359 [Edaphochlamys debaryana]
MDQGSACGAAFALQTEASASAPRRWYSVLAELQTPAEPSTSAEQSAESVSALLREALLCVRGDEQWSGSGIAELLCRALEMVEKGCVQSGIKTSLGLLDFHKMVEKYRQVVASRTKSSSTSSGKRQSSDEQDSDTSEDACGPLKRQRTLSGSLSMDCDDLPSPAEFAVPHLPAKKAPHVPAPNRTAGPTGAPPAPATATWVGNVWQSAANGRDVTYCRISVPLPVECAKELTELDGMEVAQLAPRKAVKLGRHRVAKVSIVEASAPQLAKLKSMAQNELVALAPLENHGLILVPYLDNAGGVRLVAFCLALHPTTTTTATTS